MNTAQAEATIAAITYRPGWRLSLGSTSEDFLRNLPPMLRVEARVEDSRVGGPNIVAHAHRLRPLGLYATPSELIDEVLHLLQLIEQHEAAEWFRVDGVITHDPHATGRGYTGWPSPRFFRPAPG